MIRVFFAIPCGSFFAKQKEIIDNICQQADIDPIIIEDHSDTTELWQRIKTSISDSEYVIADISSPSKNVVVELGYAENTVPGLDL